MAAYRASDYLGQQCAAATGFMADILFAWTALVAVLLIP